MSLIDYKIIDVALRVNSHDSIDLFLTTTPLGSQIVDVALMANPPDSIELLDVTTPTVGIVAMNSGPRGPKGDSGEWVALTQSEYDALNPPDPDVLYVIIQ